jgi:hypothetical protein
MDQRDAIRTRAIDMWTAKDLARLTACLSRLEGASSRPDRLRTRRNADLRRDIARVERHRAVFLGCVD